MMAGAELRPLDTMLVADLGDGIATAYAGRLLADAGATVVRIESAAGTSLRGHRWSPDAGVGAGEVGGPLFRYLDAGKRSVLAPGSHVLDAADVVLCDDGGGAVLAAARPETIVVSYTPFGLDGPDAARPSSPLVVQARAGSIAGRGYPDGRPVQAGGDLADWIAGAAAAAAVLAAWRCGAGTVIDLSSLETAVSVYNGMQSVASELTGLPSPVPARVAEVPSIERTADGWVGFCTLSAAQFGAFAELIGHPEWSDHPEISRIDWRAQHGRLIRPEIEAWTTTKTVDEVVALATAARVPCAPVGNGATLATIDQLRVRGCFVEGEDGLVQPAPPARIGGRSRVQRGRAPAVGADDSADVVTARRAAVRPPAVGRWPLPLSGIRVFDLTSFWAGPAASQFLGALGAEVIKVESAQRPDGTRLGTSYGVGGDHVWERSPLFMTCNTSKLGITLDLTRPEGIDIARRILDRCDVLVENYTPRVAERFGLLESVRDDQIVVRMPAWGLEGPWRDRPGFAQTMEQATGLAWRTGHPDAPPIVPRGPCDPNGAYHAAFATLLALIERDRVGRGAVVESALVDAALAIAAEQVVEFAHDGTVVERLGNRSAIHAPQGVYDSAEHERPVAITVRGEDDWVALCHVIERADLAEDEELRTSSGRRARHDQLDAAIGGWTSRLAPSDIADRLTAAGVPAAALVNPREVGDDAHLVARGFFEPVDHPVAGVVRLPGFPGRIGGRDEPFHRFAAPLLGADSERVLAELADVDAGAFTQLVADGIVGFTPT